MITVTFDRIREIAADVLQVPPGRITLQSSTKDIESWDSVHHLNLILALEQAFETQFEPDEIDQMISMDRVLSVLENKIDQRS